MAPATKKKPSKPVKPQKAPKKVQIVPIKEDSTSESEEEEAPQLQQLQLDGSDSDLSSDGDDQLADDFLQGSDDEDEDNYGEEKGSDLESGSGLDEADDSESGEEDIARKSRLIDKKRERDSQAAADDLQTNIQTNIQDESDEFTLPTKQIDEQEQNGGRGIPDYIMNLEDVPSTLPTHLELQKTRVFCNLDAPQHTDTIQYSGAYAALGVDNSVRLDNFYQNFKVEVKRITDEDMEFDMIGIDPAVANAFRRILIAEVPTMAIERVYMANNTSLVQDEVLSHRLGLIPIAADPKLFEYPDDAGGENNEKNTIVFKLHVRCEKGQPRLTVKSDKLKWLPNGSELIAEGTKSAADPTPKTFTNFNQKSLPKFSKNPAPYNLDVIVAKLGPGQEIELEAHAVKGIGKTHAKWSPVATAWYRMLPEVVLTKDVKDELAEELVSKCPAKVFDIEDIGRGRKKAVVKNARACTLCRECIREAEEGEEGGEGEKWTDRVSLRRVKDHFIFTIESTGAIPPDVLFTEAVKILEDKCDRVITELS